MICHSGLAAKSVERESKRDFMPLPGDPESINADRNRLQLGGRSDKSGQNTNSSFRHSELVSESFNKSIDSGSEAGMTKMASNNLRPAIRSDKSSRIPRTPSRHSDGSQSLSMPVNLIRHLWQQKSRKTAFTMAEVLITLGIIGIVAAMTLPSLIQKHQKKVLVTKLKKTYSIFSQALIQSQLVNGEFSTWPVRENIVPIEYFNRYYKPYFNGSQFCISAAACGYKAVGAGSYANTPWKNLKGNTIGWNLASGPSRVCFLLNDGSFVFLPRNSNDENGELIYVSTIYIDINGPLSPNVLGKDVFLFKIDNKKGFIPYCYDRTQEQINNGCTKNSSGNNNCCTAKIMMDGWEIKDDYPW